MVLLAILTTFLFLSHATSLSILLPFYVHPSTSPASWDGLSTTIAKYSNVQWQVIVNPNSGPGTTETKPEPAYVDAISMINSHNNAVTLGYVPTGYAQRAYSEIIADIDVYASWGPSSTDESNTTIAGIFLDEVISEAQATQTNIAFYAEASAHTKATLASTVGSVVLNPGTLGPEALFESCDLMVEREMPVSAYEGASTIAALRGEYLDQSALILYGASASTDVGALVQTMVQPGSSVGAVYVDYGACTTADGQPTGCYTQFSLETLDVLAAAVSAV